MKHKKHKNMRPVQQFKYQLIKNKFSKNTIKMYTNYLSVFLQFLQEENTEIKQAKYTDIINFTEHLKHQKKSTGNINRHLTAIRHFYNLSNYEKNPAEGVILKGTTRNIPTNLLEEKELFEIYETYKTYNLREKRNKVILGLLINQAPTTEELHKLKPEHLLLEKGKIIIPGGKRSNQRTLKLQPYQILELHNYIKNIRPKINKNSKQLFTSANGKPELKNTLLHLFRELKKKYPNIKNAKQIRMSVITNKLKTQNLRQVQYFAGHKYVSSTERYKLNNIEDLKKEVAKFHPLN